MHLWWKRVLVTPPSSDVDYGNESAELMSNSSSQSFELVATGSSSNDPSTTFTPGSSNDTHDTGADHTTQAVRPCGSSNLGLPPFHTLHIPYSSSEPGSEWVQVGFNTMPDDHSSSNVTPLYTPSTTDVCDTDAYTAELTIDGDSLHPAAFAPRASDLTDLVDQQKFERLLDAATASQNMKLEPTETNVLSAKLYDIPTLLRLREDTQGARVELKVNPGVLSENVFRESKTARVMRQENLRPRGVSAFAHRSMESIDDLTFPGRDCMSSDHPLRLPTSPPKLPNIQKIEGFARFLKQHASPPHHRVTAGGRIVPTGPLAPPPMLDLNSIDGIVRKQTIPTASNNREILLSDHAKVTQLQHRYPAYSEDDSSNKDSQANFGYIGSSMRSHNPGHIDHSIGNGLQQTSLGGGCFAGSYMNPTAQPPGGPVPVTILQDGSTVYSINGLQYRSFWNGAQTVMEPLYVPPTLPVQQEHPTVSFPQMPLSYPAWPGIHSVPTQSTYFDNVANGFQSYHSEPFHNLRGQNPQDTLDILRSKLTSLDKHVALHLHQLTQNAHDTLVAQRKRLVEQIDNIRVTKVQSEHSAPLSRPAVGSYSAADMQGYHQSFGNQSVIPNLNVSTTFPRNSNFSSVVGHSPSYADRTYTQAGSSTKNNLEVSQMNLTNNAWPNHHRGLSPSAPAFIPSIAQTDTSAAKTSLQNSSQFYQHGHLQRPINLASSGGALSGSNLAQSTTSSNIESTIACGDKDGPMRPANTAATYDTDTASGLSNQVQEAIVPPHAGEYIHRMGLNPPDQPKRYCTTSTEFQEVIRRVREQASLYGCAGGQSKNPAYDAEQDVRWAMSQSGPIPLPMPIPDHIASPRPWNWQDSVFNDRVARQNSSSCQPENSGEYMSNKVKTPDNLAPSSAEEPYADDDSEDDYVEFNPYIHGRTDKLDNNPSPTGFVMLVSQQPVKCKVTRPFGEPEQSEEYKARPKPEGYIAPGDRGDVYRVQDLYRPPGVKNARPLKQIRSEMSWTSTPELAAKDALQHKILGTLKEYSKARTKPPGYIEPENRPELFSPLEYRQGLIAACGLLENEPARGLKAQPKPHSAKQYLSGGNEPEITTNYETQAKLAVNTEGPARTMQATTYNGSGKPTRRPYQAYVESDVGSPSMSSKNFHVKLGSADAVRLEAANNNLGISGSQNWSRSNDHWEPITESKNRWEADEDVDSAPFDSWGGPKPDSWGEPKLARTELAAAKLKPKVNLPTSVSAVIGLKWPQPPTSNTAQSPATFPGHRPNRAHNASSRSNDTSPASTIALGTVAVQPLSELTQDSKRKNVQHDFLRGMLNSPAYSTACNSPYHTVERTQLPGMEFQVDYNAQSGSNRSRRVTEKENMRSEGWNDAGFDGHRASMASSLNSFGKAPSVEHDARAIKARSSLASSNYQARGHVPPYDGAGDHLAATAYRHRNYNNSADSRPASSHQDYAQPSPDNDFGGSFAQLARYGSREFHDTWLDIPDRNGGSDFFEKMRQRER